MAGFAHRQYELRDPLIKPQHYPKLSCVTLISPLAIASSAPVLPVAAHTMQSVCQPLHAGFQGGTQQPDRFLSPEGSVIHGGAEWLVLQLKQVPDFRIPS